MKKRQPIITRGRIIFYTITLAAFIVAYIKFSDLLKLRDVFLHADWNWLFGMLAFQFLNYVFTTLNYQEILRIKNLRLSFAELFPIAYIITFITSVIPSGGVSGQVFFIQYL